VLRDIDILKRFDDCAVGLTITSLDEKLRKYFEPKSSPVKNRLKALKKLHDEGIRTYAFIGPIFPLLIDLEEVFRALHKSIDFFMAESLNVRCGNWKEVENVLRTEFPQIGNNYQDIINDNKFWIELEAKLRSLSNEYSIPMIGFYRH
jgi:DNA repair photolyase